MTDKLADALKVVDERINCYTRKQQNENHPEDTRYALQHTIEALNMVRNGIVSLTTHPPQRRSDCALEEFDRFCRFIDGLNMGGFVENDFMSKPIQTVIRAALTNAPQVVDVLPLFEKQGYPHDVDDFQLFLARHGLIIIDAPSGKIVGE